MVSGLLNRTDPKSSGPWAVSVLPGMDLLMAAGTAWDTAVEALHELHSNPAVRQ